jgi:hypothetical protein
MSGAQAAMGAGEARRKLLQDQMDAQRNIGLQKLQVAQSALGQNLPNLGTTETQPYTKNPLTGAFGGALAGSKFGVPGSIIGGLLGLLG